MANMKGTLWGTGSLNHPAIERRNLALHLEERSAAGPSSFVRVFPEPTYFRFEAPHKTRNVKMNKIFGAEVRKHNNIASARMNAFAISHNTRYTEKERAEMVDDAFGKILTMFAQANRKYNQLREQYGPQGFVPVPVPAHLGDPIPH